MGSCCCSARPISSIGYGCTSSLRISLSDMSMVSNWSCVAPRFSIAGILQARSLISLSLHGLVN
jgi:hypothetical protein